MKVLFISDNFPPEVNAPATRTVEHCALWVKSGIQVTVITCFPNFPDGKLYEGYRQKLYTVEEIEGIKIVRVLTYMTANSGFVRRTLDYISFGIAAFIAGLFIRTDLIVATSPQFFTAVWARWLSFFKGKPWVMEVRDLWPESIRSVGAMNDNLFFRYFERLERRLYRSALHIITVTDAFREEIIKKGIAADKISVIKNGANLNLFNPEISGNGLLEKLHLNGKFLVGFIGTLGMAHKLDFIIRSAPRVRDNNIHFLIVGAGADRENLEAILSEHNPGNVTLLGMIPKAKVPEYLAALDISLINLRKSDNFKTVIPSKIFESAAMEKPILLGVDGEARDLVETYNAGLYFEPENEADFISKLLILQKDKKIYNDFKIGCRKLAFDFDRKKLAKQMEETLVRILG